MDISKQIRETKDVEYLIQLEKYVDMDISNIGKDSDRILAMKASMYNTTSEKYMEKQKVAFNKLKQEIQDRIRELS